MTCKFLMCVHRIKVRIPINKHLNTITTTFRIVYKINCKYIESLNTSMVNLRSKSTIADINSNANTLFIRQKKKGETKRRNKNGEWKKEEDDVTLVGYWDKRPVIWTRSSVSVSVFESILHMFFVYNLDSFG